MARESIDKTVLDDISQSVLDLGNKAAIEEAKNFVKPSMEQVKQAAKELVEYATLLKEKNSGVLEQLNSLNYENENSVLNFSKKMIQSETEYLNLMDKVYNFQNIANEFLGQKVLMTFVAVSGSTGKVDLYGFEADTSHIFVEKTAEGKGANYAGRYSKIGVIKRNSQKLINSNYESSGGKKTLDNTFQETWQRFRMSKARYKMGGAAYILWKKGNSWDGRWISGAGPLGESYVAFFIDEYVFSNVIETAVSDFILNNKYGVAAVDNASGLLKGDVKKGIYELGVKAKGAQALGYTEIIGYANELLQASNIDVFLKDLKKKLDEGTPNAVKKLTEVQRQELEGPNGLLTDFEKRIEKIGMNFGEGGVSVWKKS